MTRQRIAPRPAGGDPGRIGAARLSRRDFVVLLSAGLILGGAAELPSAPRSKFAAPGDALQIVAHEDDDLLFQSPDVLRDVRSGRRIRTVYVTAGDAARDESYWSSRERGSLAAYAQMAGVANRWSTSATAAQGQLIRMLTLTSAPQVSLVFMRLPDGNRRGTGMIRHNHESLMRLWQGSIDSIHAVDGSATYTGDSLRKTFTDLMTEFRPTTVRTQDWTIPFGTGDNADHTATALFTRQAHHDYGSPENVLAYAGYPAWVRPANVTGSALVAKRSAFQAYALHDPLMCLEPWCAGDWVASLRLARQYITASGAAG